MPTNDVSARANSRHEFSQFDISHVHGVRKLATVRADLEWNSIETTAKHGASQRVGLDGHTHTHTRVYLHLFKHQNEAHYHYASLINSILKSARPEFEGSNPKAIRSDLVVVGSARICNLGQMMCPWCA